MKNYKLIWEENFDEPILNSGDWNFSIGRGYKGWGNAESQYYTKNNHKIEDNTLIILGKPELPDDHSDYHREGGLHGFDYTSTKITTQNKRSFKYGYFEIEAIVPRGKGSWPAIWFMPVKEGKWPECGEIDLMEHVGRNHGTIHHSLHTGAYNFQNNDSQYTTTEELDFVSEEFVKYGMEWTPEYFEFYVNDSSVGKLSKGQESKRVDQLGWPFDKEFYLIINLAIGGYWGGEIDSSKLPFEFKVRNIKYYR